MEDYSSNGKEEILCSYMLFSQYVNISISVMYVLSIFFLFFQPYCLEVIPGNAYTTVCSRYLPIEEALSLELESNPHSPRSVQ